MCQHMQVDSISVQHEHHWLLVTATSKLWVVLCKRPTLKRVVTHTRRWQPSVRTGPSSWEAAANVCAGRGRLGRLRVAVLLAWFDTVVVVLAGRVFRRRCRWISSSSVLVALVLPRCMLLYCNACARNHTQEPHTCTLTGLVRKFNTVLCGRGGVIAVI